MLSVLNLPCSIIQCYICHISNGICGILQSDLFETGLYEIVFITEPMAQTWISFQVETSVRY